MLYLLLLILLISSIFLGSEFLKKFGYMQKFVQDSNQTVVWYYDGKKKPGMYTVSIEGSQNFAVLIGFKLKIGKYSGVDHYGFVKANKQHKAIFSTYLGRSPVEFYFFSNTNCVDNPLTVVCNEETQTYKVTAIYQSHWWQRIGFLG